MLEAGLALRGEAAMEAVAAAAGAQAKFGSELVREPVAGTALALGPSVEAEAAVAAAARVAAQAPEVALDV